MGEAGFEFARQFELEGLLAEFERELVKLVGETTAEDEGKADSEGP